VDSNTIILQFSSDSIFVINSYNKGSYDIRGHWTSVTEREKITYKFIKKTIAGKPFHFLEISNNYTYAITYKQIWNPHFYNSEKESPNRDGSYLGIFQQIELKLISPYPSYFLEEGKYLILDQSRLKKHSNSKE